MRTSLSSVMLTESVIRSVGFCRILAFTTLLNILAQQLWLCSMAGPILMWCLGTNNYIIMLAVVFLDYIRLVGHNTKAGFSLLIIT